jgi:glyoxylate/hydroxypyruvate reductase A
VEYLPSFVFTFCYSSYQLSPTHLSPTSNTAFENMSKYRKLALNCTNIIRRPHTHATMGIVVIHNDIKNQYWKDTFREVAPEIPVYKFNEPHPVEDIHMAIVWKHPVGSLNQYPNLKGVQALGAGADFLLADDTIPSCVSLLRVVDPSLARDMAEFALALTMGTLKNLPYYGRAQMQQKWDPRPYRRIEDVTVGIMGLGTLGLAVAEKLQINGFQLCGWTRSSKPNVSFSLYQGADQLSKFLGCCDILICLLPWTPATTGMLNKQTFAALKDGAHVINLARGPIVTDEDLIDALDSGKLSGATLDVFHQEPLPESHPFWKHEKVFMTPHIASVTDASSVVPQIQRNYHALKNGTELENEVFKERGY